MAQKEFTSIEKKIVKLTKSLADERRWNWARMSSNRDAADAVLKEMAELGLIKHREHPLGGNTWIVGGERFGRVD